MTLPKALTTILLVLFVFVTSCTPSNELPSDEMIDVGTHGLYIHCLGRGRPTIVIDTGVGEPYES